MPKKIPRGLRKKRTIKLKCTKSCATVEPEAFWEEGVLYDIDESMVMHFMGTNKFIKVKVN